jgi:hypothetical protein
LISARRHGACSEGRSRECALSRAWPQCLLSAIGLAMPDPVIICRCGRWNQLQGQGAKQGYFKCEKCGNKLFITNPPSAPRRKKWAILLLVPLAAAGAGYASIRYAPFIKQMGPSSNSSVNPARVSNAPAVPIQSKPQQASPLKEPIPSQAPRPLASFAQQPEPAKVTKPEEPKTALVPSPIKTGIIRRRGKGRQVARLTIEADSGNYAIKLLDKTSNTESLMVLIGANQTFETRVPLGTYRIVGASGDVWYGERDLFGPSTHYFVLRRSKDPSSLVGDDEFQFALKDNTYYGQHLILRKSIDGNLSTQAITHSEFHQE